MSKRQKSNSARVHTAAAAEPTLKKNTTAKGERARVCLFCVEKRGFLDQTRTGLRSQKRGKKFRGF